jgi:ATP-dependent DNA helicase RecQ
MSDEVLATLKRYFGFERFRPYQREIVEAVLSGRDVFAALPTGGGKSLCYQLPALLLPHLTVVVSPLIALMKDQVDGAIENGIPAAYLNSSLTPEDARDTWQRLSRGEVKLLYASPERLSIPSFRNALSQIGVSYVAVDEAHCVSEWGHEFRPDYRALHVLRLEIPDVPMAAFTATATREVQSDVIRQLGLREPVVVRGSFDRKEIFYRVKPKRRANQQILEFISRHPEEPGIVYRSTRKAADETASYLADRGVAVASYHAGLSSLQRQRRQDEFVQDRIDVVVATIAFGMGIDKSNVRWILHGDLPRSIEGYYQETGRAARDGESAEALLLYGPGDIAKVRWHIDRTESDIERERAERRLSEILRYVDSTVCRRRQLLAHFGESHEGRCAGCDVCAGEIELEDATTEAQMLLSAMVRTGQRFGAHHIVDVVLGTATDKVLDRGHQNLPTFGVGSAHPRGYWLSLLRDLEAAEHILRAPGRTGGYRVSTKGRLLLRGKETFLAGRRPAAGASSSAAATARKSAQSARPGQAETESGEADPRVVAGGSSSGANRAPAHDWESEQLFQCLRRLRLRIARSRGVPPYVVFSDKSLRSMVETVPVDPESFLACHGVGERKLEQYGDTFLSAIREFRATGECGP